MSAASTPGFSLAGQGDPPIGMVTTGYSRRTDAEKGRREHLPKRQKGLRRFTIRTARHAPIPPPGRAAWDRRNLSVICLATSTAARRGQRGTMALDDPAVRPDLAAPKTSQKEIVMNAARPWIKAACIALVPFLLPTLVGCPELVGIVAVPIEHRCWVQFDRTNTSMTCSTSSSGSGAVDPREDTTIDVIVYSIGALTVGDLAIRVELVAGDTVVQEYNIALEQTAFEPLPAGVRPIEGFDGTQLDTRYAARLVVNCASCSPTDLLPQTYAWRTTATRASDASVSGVVVFNYSLYLGPIVAP